MMMVSNIHAVTHSFEVLQTTKRSQAAVMTLSPGAFSSEEPNVHEHSDQILLVIEGEAQAEVGHEKRLLKAGEMCLIPAGTKHRILNVSKKPAVTFNVYSPPEYTPDDKD